MILGEVCISDSLPGKVLDWQLNCAIHFRTQEYFPGIICFKYFGVLSYMISEQLKMIVIDQAFNNDT